jgi:hypothetical protein
MTGACCPDGHKSAAGSTFCSTCGKPLPIEQDVRCPNSHDIPVGSAYCGLCGLPTASRAESERVTAWARALDDQRREVWRAKHRFVAKFVPWNKRLSLLQRITLCVVLVAAASGIGVLAYQAHERQQLLNLSYHDGYYYGQQGYATDAEAEPNGWSYACANAWDEEQSSGATDNYDSFVNGCFDGYQAAQSAANYQSQHP